MKTPIRYFVPIVLCFICCIAFAGKIPRLRHVRVRDQRETYGRTIIYGSFTQIFGAPMSGGYQQDICVYNIDSNKYYLFGVTPSSKKGNYFRYYIPPGNYAVMKYIWYSKIGNNHSLLHVDDIFKTGRMTNAFEFDEDPMARLDEKYQFYITHDTPTYVGVWHFDNIQVSFTEDKRAQDSVETYVTLRKKLDLTKSLISIPH